MLNLSQTVTIFKTFDVVEISLIKRDSFQKEVYF